MNATAVVMMALICGLVWGGFALLLCRALRREGGKSRVEDDKPRVDDDR